MMRTHSYFYKAAFDGDLNTVKKLLTNDCSLLDKPFEENGYHIFSQGLAQILFFSKKMLGFLGLLLAIPGKSETSRSALILSGITLGLGTGAWNVGDLMLQYYKKSMHGWTPLDCAAFGYANGNEKALEVALYLIEQGANGAMYDANRLIFEMVGNETFTTVSKKAIKARDQSWATHSRTLETKLTHLHDDLEKTQQQSEQIKKQLHAANDQLSKIAPIGYTKKGARIFVEKLRQNAAAADSGNTLSL